MFGCRSAFLQPHDCARWEGSGTQRAGEAAGERSPPAPSLPITEPRGLSEQHELCSDQSPQKQALALVYAYYIINIS